MSEQQQGQESFGFDQEKFLATLGLQPQVAKAGSLSVSTEGGVARIEFVSQYTVTPLALASAFAASAAMPDPAPNAESDPSNTEDPDPEPAPGPRRRPATKKAAASRSGKQ